MLDRVFGPHRSVQRQVSIVLSFVVVVLGAVLVVTDGPGTGVPVMLFGILAGAILARMAENRVARAASTELLGSITGEVDEEQLQAMVERARASSPAKMPDVQGGEDGELDVDALPWTPEQQPRRRS